ncbi:MAG: outer membrane protein assembly factor BamE [Rhodobacteraceae bacterium]|nr:outer membrane protein assembly factor BamE [Paracoccaceae bacterium]
MHFKTLRYAAIALVGAGLALAGCAPTTTVHGYIPPAAEVARLTPGVDTTATVEETLGLPSSTGLLRDTAWFYVQSVFENYAYNPARVVDRTVLVVNFDPNGVVTGVERFGVEEGRIVSLTSRTTETGGRELGVLEQLFGNILNIDAEQFDN